MQYRVKEEEVNGRKFFYPQYKKFLFWRSIIYMIRGSRHQTVYQSLGDAIECCRVHQREQFVQPPKKPVYHMVAVG